MQAFFFFFISYSDDLFSLQAEKHILFLSRKLIFYQKIYIYEYVFYRILYAEGEIKLEFLYILNSKLNLNSKRMIHKHTYSKQTRIRIEILFFLINLKAG